jgi:hypothetical protein
MLERGRDRFEIYCAPCHGWDGQGDGMVVRRGFPRAASYHTERLRDLDDGVLLGVIERGLGKMPPYGSALSPIERASVVAWIRVLQRAYLGTLQDVPVASRDSILPPVEAPLESAAAPRDPRIDQSDPSGGDPVDAAGDHTRDASGLGAFEASGEAQ